MALRASAEESSKYLECLMQIRNAHFSTVEAMLSSEVIYLIIYLI